MLSIVKTFVIDRRRNETKEGGEQTIFILLEDEIKDTKEAIRILISKKNRQHNGQKKQYKRTNNGLQNIHIKLKIE